MPRNLKEVATGTIKTIGDADVDNLLKSGRWVEATKEEERASAPADAAEEAYTSASNKAATFVNSAVSGATFGLLSDTTQEAKNREQYNPGTAMLGGLAGMVADPLGAVGVIGSAGRTAAGLLKLEKVSKPVAKGVALAAEISAQDLTTNVVANIRSGRDISDAFTEDMHWGSVIAFGAGGTAISAMGGRLARKAEQARAFTAKSEESLKAAGSSVDVAKAKAAAMEQAANIAKNTPKPALNREDYFILQDAVNGARSSNIVHNEAAITRRAKEVQALAANSATDERAWSSVKSRWEAREAARVAASADGSLASSYQQEVAAYTKAVEAERAPIYQQYLKERGVDDVAAHRSAKVDDGSDFEQYLRNKGRGDLTLEGQARGSLSSHVMDAARRAGDDLPTTEDGFREWFAATVDDAGYKVKANAKAKRATNGAVIDKADNAYEGFLPEEGLRPLSPDEATRTFTLSGVEIGQAGKRTVRLSAEQARTLSTGRMAQLVEQLERTEGKAAVSSFLATVSPEARMAVLGARTGLIGYAEADVLQKHLLRTLPASERAARTEYELSKSLDQVVEHNGIAMDRPSLRVYPPKPVDAATKARPFPLEKPRTDYTTELAAVKEELDTIKSASLAVKGLKVPNNPSQFLRMTNAELDKFVMSAQAAEASKHVEAAAAGARVREAVAAMVERAGIQSDDAYEGLRALRSHMNTAVETHGKTVHKVMQDMSASRSALREAEKAAKLAARNVGVEAKALGFVEKQEKDGIVRKALAGGAMRAGSRLGGAVAGSMAGPLGSIAGFALGGAVGRTAMESVMGSRKALSTQAIAALAVRREKMAKAYEKIVDLAKPFLVGSNVKRITGIFTGDKDFLLDQLPPDYPIKENATDEEIIRAIMTTNASVTTDPDAAGYRAVKDIINDQPELAKSVAETVAARGRVLARVLPTVPYYGYASQAKVPMSRSQVQQAKMAIEALSRPTDVLAAMVSAGHFPASELGIIRETNPSLVAEAAMEASNRLFAPDENGVTLYEKLPTNVKREFSRFLGVEMEAGDSPAYIAGMAAMHAQARQPKENAAKRVRGGPGKFIQPIEDTEAQRTTYR